MTFRWVSPDYFSALDIPILQGAGFSEEQLTSSDHFVALSKDLATRLFPDQNAVGERLQFDKQEPSCSLVHRRWSRGQRARTAASPERTSPEYYLLRRNRAEDWDRNGTWGSNFGGRHKNDAATRCDGALDTLRRSRLSIQLCRSTLRLFTRE